MGMIWDIKKFAIHDGPGIRTTVFFKGCPLACWWCHNPESRSPQRQPVHRELRCVRCGHCIEACPNDAISMDDGDLRFDEERCVICGECAEACPAEARQILGREVTVGELMAELRKDLVFYDESGGGVTMSGGEPLLQPDFLLELLNACRSEGIHSTVDTTGHAGPEVIDRVARAADLFLYDLKLIDDERHRTYCSSSNDRILANLRTLAASGSDVIIRLPLIPGVNDDEENLAATGRFVAALDRPCPIDILPYQIFGVDKYEMMNCGYRLPDARPPSDDEVEAAVRILRGFELTVTVRGEQ